MVQSLCIEDCDVLLNGGKFPMADSCNIKVVCRYGEPSRAVSYGSRFRPINEREKREGDGNRPDASLEYQDDKSVKVREQGRVRYFVC